ncbi:hypothetical protein [Cryobacterium sp. MLB-32]|uniref:hypothetical protein n=1 Tax=Cryobacterium sp. MLB-32 TaxID=1529318 RepID=UPI00269C5321|nr:hypothetical protein [Cryobacterium sp. MLB-32]
MTTADRPAPKKILYIDLDNTLVDFPSGIGRLSEAARLKYEGSYDDAPGIFALMEPLPDALEAYRELSEHFDTYILSTARGTTPRRGTTRCSGCRSTWGSRATPPPTSG